MPLTLETQNITTTCRYNRGDSGAWDEAVRRLREVYDAQVARYPDCTLSLSIARSGETALGRAAANMEIDLG